MSFPIQITYRGMDSSETLDRLIRSEAEKLGKFFDRILRCRALVERQPGHHYAGSPFHVRLTLAVPGRNWSSAASRIHPTANSKLYIKIPR